ncbi:hypothetical protein ACIODW_24155 [Streptomyces sp. NPDC087897]|uniref:hypothetical protein n=1 Tax=Streptomyces sp. NPDC087897 TaxID=3365817 RepID=UPI003801B13A
MERRGLDRKQVLGLAALGAGAIVLGPGTGRAEADAGAAAPDAGETIDEGVL